MLHVKKYAHEEFLSEYDKAAKKAVTAVSRLAVTAEEQLKAWKGHPSLRNTALNRKERRTTKYKLDKARGRGFTKSNKGGRKQIV